MRDHFPRESDVIIIGAGLAGLTTAIHLQQRGKSVLILEATDRPGGRIKTDEVDGYLLDLCNCRRNDFSLRCGFDVLLNFNNFV